MRKLWVLLIPVPFPGKISVKKSYGKHKVCYPASLTFFFLVNFSSKILRANPTGSRWPISQFWNVRLGTPKRLAASDWDSPFRFRYPFTKSAKSVSILFSLSFQFLHVVPLPTMSDHRTIFQVLYPECHTGVMPLVFLSRFQAAAQLSYNHHRISINTLCCFSCWTALPDMMKLILNNPLHLLL